MTTSFVVTDDLRRRLRDGMAALGITATDAQQQSLLDYLALLSKWNAVYSLTAIRDPEEMVRRHLLDSLAVLAYIYGSRVIDVGTGAGVPGIPCAIMRPDMQFVLLDSNRKKIRFVQQAIIELKLANAVAVAERAERYQPPSACFDTVLARAVTTLREAAELTRHLVCSDGGRWVVMKGSFPHDELRDLPNTITVAEVARLNVPGLDAQRHLVILQPTPPAPTGELS